MKKIICSKTKIVAFCLFGLLSISLISCNSNSDKKQEETQESSKSEEELAKQDIIQISLESNDRMQFDKNKIVVYEGQTVQLKLIHTGSMPKTSMGHNFVLLDQSISISAYSKKALSEKNNDYVVNDPAYTLAHTKMLGGGESDEITFKAPKKGEYDFICSFPGHYSNMKGKFIVK